MNYLVACPATDEREVCTSQERAIDVCYSMHKDSGHYAYVEDYLGWTVCEYGDINKSPGYNKPYDIEDDCYLWSLQVGMYTYILSCSVHHYIVHLLIEPWV